jgi:Galactose oxidase-like, Early set domain/Divergent InlB B-repeat domain/PKD domain
MKTVILAAIRCSLMFLVSAVAAALTHLSVLAQTCPNNVPHITGTWTVLPYQMPINPISANLLRNGKVLIVAGSENDASNNAEGAESYRAAVWDPSGTDESSISVQNLTYDVFCSGTAALFDGRSLIVGGTSDYLFTGENRASIFNPATSQYVQSQNMVDGRWYATATALADGRIMAMSGLTQSGGTSRTVEIYDLQRAGTGWNPPTSVPFTPPLYPKLALLPGGKLFYTGHGSGTSANAWIFNPATGAWTQSAATSRNRGYGSSVLLPLLPPNYVPRVMNFGGGNPATSSTDIIDLSVATPSYTSGPDMSTGRIQMNAIILPNGKVLAEGGSANNEAPNTPGKTADLYDPVSNTMASAGTAAYSRLYHSVALLLPDATVMSMGSNPGDRGSYEAAIEIYTPSYLYDSNDHLVTTNRPQITALSFSGPIHYVTPFSVSYASTSPISSAVLIRPGSTTHTTDMEQRLIGLCGATSPCTASNNILSLTTPPDGSIAPPGYYMLFLLDSAGVPSKARFIQLTPNSYSLVSPTGAITTPSGDMTITEGSAISFGTSTSASKYSWVFPGGSPAASTAQNPGNVTFSVPGTYTVSLTVIDATGNSDPSPPTRTITVLPTSPDFSITVGPAAQEVVPGGLATYTVTVTPLSGFTGTVNLSVSSESGFSTGITSGGFSPASISTGGSSTLTMRTTTATVPYALSLTITGTSGTINHTASTTLLVNLAPPAGLTAIAGDGQVSLSWPASVGANGYHVKRAQVNGGPYETFACPTGTSIVDTGLVNGTTYYYTVSASYTGGPDAGGESADSVQASATPQGSTPTVQVTIQTTPTGLGLSVDGTTYTSPQTFSWASGSSHTIATTSPQNGGTGVRYLWTRWSDNGAISHTVAPTTSRTYTATFRTQYYLTMSHGTGGTVSPASGWRNSGTTVSISATPTNNTQVSYSFAGWTGTGLGSYSGTNNPASITMNGPIRENAAFTQNPIQVTVRTNPAGRTFTVDGTPYTAAQTFSWPPGSSHTIATTSPQSGGTGVRYVWMNWSGGGAISRTVAPTINTTYTATFRTQYFLTMTHGTGGTVKPASGWRNSGAAVSISATPASGYHFTNWAGSGTGSFSGTNNPASITMGGPITETATFTHN